MQTKTTPYPLATAYGIRNRINTNPDYQRPAVWSKAQKQLLIDTIVRGYDIPKMYWRQVGTKPERFDVVDGQQRLRAIWEFMGGEFPIAKNADPVDGENVAGAYFSELPPDLRIQFDTYQLHIVIITESEEDEVREMFLRLQNGTSLKAQEKRNAYPGQMRDFVKKLGKHPFWNKVPFSGDRFVYDHLSAQYVCLEIAGNPTNIKNTDLNKIYEKYSTFSESSDVAKQVKRKLDELNLIFKEKRGELERYNIISLYCVLSQLMADYNYISIKDKIFDWFLAFEDERSKYDVIPEDEGDPEWIAYKGRISHSTDSKDSIEFRTTFMMTHLLQTIEGVVPKDEVRQFTHDQRKAIYRKNNGICQLRLKCEGNKVSWDAWHADHVRPWSHGGLTTVENGQVACPECNLAKGSQLLG